MSRLTPQQRAEIMRHRIPLSRVFDATGLTRQQAIKAMSVDKEIVMVNGLKCSKDSSHVLRTRYGHCVECNAAVLAMQARKRTEGYTYLAGSRATKLLKIGMSIDTDAREARLNHLRYGGASDWVILAVARSDKAGLVEYQAQQELAPHFVDGSYHKDGRTQSCYELFNCSHGVALEALKRAVRGCDGELTYEAPVSGHFGS